MNKIATAREGQLTTISVGDIVIVHDDKPRGFW